MRRECKIAEVWKDVPSFDGELQASSYGRIKSLWKGHENILKQFMFSKNGQKQPQWLIRFQRNGSYKDYKVARLVYEAFIGPIPKGFSVVHKNDMHTDNEPENLKLMKRSSLGIVFGGAAKRKPVCKMDKTGEVIEFYSSATQAAAANNVSVQTITNRCNRVYKSVATADGYIYSWDD